MNKKINIILLTVVTLILVIGGFFIINMKKDPSNSPVSLYNGDYHYVASNVLEVTKDEHIFDTIMTDKDNNFIYMTESAEVCYVYKGFEEDREILSPNLVSTRADLNVKGFTMDDKGNIFVLYGVFRGKETMNIYNKDKELVEADIDMEGDLAEIKSMHYFNEKLYILDYERNLQIYSTDGKLTNDKIYSDHIYSIDIDEAGNMYMIVIKGMQQNIVKVNIANQKIFDIQIEVPPQNNINCSKINDSLYTTDGKYIYEFDSAGSLLRREVEFASDASLVLGSIHERGVQSLNTLICDDKENFYVLIYGNKNLPNNIYMLSKTNGNKPPETPKQEIILTASYEQDFILNAIAKYNIKSEDYRIVLDAPYKSYDEFMDNAQEAGEKLALRIMANDVGDIVATGGNGLNYYDLLKTDAFMDLDELIKDDKNYADINKQVLNGIAFDGKLRGLPLGIAYYKMMYNRSLGEELNLDLDFQNIKWSEILELAINLNNENGNISIFNTQEKTTDTYFVLLLQSNMPDLIDMENKTVDLKQDWFLELVSDFKVASKLDNFMHYSKYDYTKPTGDDSIFYFEKLQGEHEKESRNVEGTHDILSLPAFVGEMNRNAIAFPYIMYSISNNSEYKDVAWDFLSYLLEVDIQSLSSLKSHPINLQAEREIREYYNMDSAVAKQHDQIMNRVDYLYDMSYYKQDILLPMAKYFNDEISLDEAIDEAEHNIWLRLNE